MTIEQTEVNVQAPSIGSIDLSFDPTGSRVRQISRRVVDNLDQLNFLLQEANNFASSVGATRRSIRSLTRRELFDDSETREVTEELGYLVEGGIECASPWQDYVFVYYGNNSPSRRSCDVVIDVEQCFTKGLRERPVKSPGRVVGETFERGFRLERLRDEVDPRDERRLIEMYDQSFLSYPYDIKTAIMGMIRSSTSLVYAARWKEDGQLYAVCATEEVTIDLEGGRTLVIREMGDSARIHKDVPRLASGLNAPLKLVLMHQASLVDVDVVFCETRAVWEPVNKINHDIGMRYRGFLAKHTVIGGPESYPESGMDGQNGRYGNMNVWAVNSFENSIISREVEEAL